MLSFIIIIEGRRRIYYAANKGQQVAGVATKLKRRQHLVDSCPLCVCVCVALQATSVGFLSLLLSAISVLWLPESDDDDADRNEEKLFPFSSFFLSRLSSML